MKRYFVAAAVFCFALAALTGCTRHGPDCGIDFCVCGPEETAAVRDTESDLVIFDKAPEPVDGGAEAVTAAKEAAPAVVVPETPETRETAEAPETVKAPEEPAVAEAPAEAAPEAGEEDFSAEEMARKIHEIEESTKNEPQIIRDIIADSYDEVPAIVSEAPAVNVEILPAEEETQLQDMAADYGKYLDIEAYDAEEEAVIAEAALVEEPAVEAVEAETPELPAVIGETAVETPAPPAIEPVIAEAPEPAQSSFLLPPPLSAAPEPGPAAFAAEVEPDRSEATEELTLDGLDDMELEFFGSISESLLEADS